MERLSNLGRVCLPIEKLDDALDAVPTETLPVHRDVELNHTVEQIRAVLVCATKDLTTLGHNVLGPGG